MTVQKQMMVYIAIMLLFFSCSGKSKDYLHEKMMPEDLPAGTVYSDKLYFCVNCHGSPGVPVVKLLINGVPYLFVVDSGSNCNLFNSEELLEGFIGLFNERDKLKVRYNSVVGITDSNILGMPFLRMNHKNAVFDYRKQILSFDQPPISKNELIPQTVWPGVWFVEFTADGSTEFGLLDTGGFSFVLRTGFGESPMYSNQSEVKSYLYSDSDVVQKHYEDVYVKQFTFGGETRKKMQYLPADSDQISALPVARRFLQVFNNLGATVFKDHVIQFDFENNVFRIK